MGSALVESMNPRRMHKNRRMAAPAPPCDAASLVSGRTRSKMVPEDLCRTVWGILNGTHQGRLFILCLLLLRLAIVAVPLALVVGCSGHADLDRELATLEGLAAGRSVSEYVDSGAAGELRAMWATTQYLREVRAGSVSDTTVALIAGEPLSWEQHAARIAAVLERGKILFAFAGTPAGESEPMQSAVAGMRSTFDALRPPAREAMSVGFDLQVRLVAAWQVPQLAEQLQSMMLLLSLLRTLRDGIEQGEFHPTPTLLDPMLDDRWWEGAWDSAMRGEVAKCVWLWRHVHDAEVHTGSTAQFHVPLTAANVAQVIRLIGRVRQRCRDVTLSQRQDLLLQFQGSVDQDAPLASGLLDQLIQRNMWLGITFARAKLAHVALVIAAYRDRERALPESLGDIFTGPAVADPVSGAPFVYSVSPHGARVQIDASHWPAVWGLDGTVDVEPKARLLVWDIPMVR